MRKLFTLRTLSLFLWLTMAGNYAFAVGDAGVQGFLSPTDPVCRGNADVIAVIQNYSNITISTITVNWEVDGNPQTPFSYNGTIDSGSVDTVLLGSFAFMTGPYTITAWTSDPNGTPDTNTTNDTASAIINVSTELTGSYTIGGTTPDFLDFATAVSALMTNGVCGPVEFNMRPAVDSVNIVIKEIPGASEVNTITFQSENGDSTSVKLVHASMDTSLNNYVIRLDSADFITFRGLTLERSGILDYGRVLEFRNGATNNTVTHCLIRGVDGVTTNSLTALLYSSAGAPSVDSMNTFTNNRLENGSLGIYMNGVNTVDLEQWTVIKDNIFVDQYSKGIQMSNQGFAIIEGNTFNTVSTYSGYAAIYLDRSLRPHQITKNRISDVPGTGIYMIDCVAQSGVHGTIANNFIHTNDSAGISMINGDYQDIVFNSILMTGATSTFTALAMHGTGTGKIVMNNILVNTGGGYAYVVTDDAVTGITTSDHNDLFTSGAFVGNYDGVQQNTLGAWISASNKDSNSVSVNPNFASVSDLHCTSIAMDDQGAPFAGITTDIDGETRSALTPDIGADEYSSVSRNVGITAFLLPADSTCGDSTTTVSVVVSNPGGFPETNFDIVTIISGAISDTLTELYTPTINAGTSDTVTFSATINTAAGGTVNFKTFTSLNVDDVHANDTLNTVRNFFTPPAAPSGTGSSICGPGSDTINATSGDSIRWYDVPMGGTPIAYGADFITPFVNATTTYYAAAFNSCEGPRTAVTLTVLPAPLVNLGNDVSINQGDSVTLDAGAGFVSYLWSTGPVTQTITVNTTGCYWVRVTNGSGCTDRDTVCVTVIQPFDMGVTQIISPKDNDCAGDSMHVMVRVNNLGSNAADSIAVIVNVTGAATSSFQDTITGGIAPGNFVDLDMGTIDVSAGGSVTVTAYTSYSNDSDNNNDTLVTVNNIIVQPPVPTGIGGSRCGPGTIVLVSSSSDTVNWYDAPTGGNLVYTGDNYVLNNLSATVTYYAQAGNYCNNQDRAEVTATIYQLPPVNLGNDTTVGGPILLDAGAGYISYQWNDFSTTQTITASATGMYSVCVTDTNGCANCDTINISIIVGIEQLGESAGLIVYPNPTNTKLTFQASEPMNGTVTYSLINAQGQIVAQGEKKNLTSETIDVSSYARGIYHLRIISETGLASYRIVVE